jgi:hypothetical protein
MGMVGEEKKKIWLSVAEARRGRKPQLNLSRDCLRFNNEELLAAELEQLIDGGHRRRRP